MNENINLDRIVIIGNSGAGKSWFSNQLSKKLCVPATELDQIHWQSNSYDVAREKSLAIEMVKNVANADKWIIEGVYGWLAQEAVPKATILIWLDIPLNECFGNLRDRYRQRGEDQAGFKDLMDWTRDYSSRQTSSSLSGHQRLFASFPHPKFRLISRRQISEFLDAGFFRDLDASKK